MTRVRTRYTASDEVTLTESYDRYSGPPQKVTSYPCDFYPSTCVETTTTQTMMDEVIPDYKRRSAKGEIFNNPMTRTFLEVIDRPAHIGATMLLKKTSSTTVPPQTWLSGEVYRLNAPSSFLTGGWYCPITVLDSEIERLKNIAITSAYAAVNQADFMVIPFLAEARSAIRSVVNLLNGVRHFIKLWAELNLKEMLGWLAPAELAQAWMEIRYGLRPLYRDAVGIGNFFQGLTKLGSKNPYRKVARGYSSGFYSEQAQNIRYLNGSTWKTIYQGTAKCSINCRAGVLVEVKPDWRGAVGLDLIAESVWELVPLSFVWDWFFNFGKFIASFTPNIGCKILASWVTVDKMLSQVTYAGKTEVIWSPPDLAAKDFSNNAFCSRVELTKQRIVEPSRPLIPQIDVNLDTAKILDLIIILKQMVMK